MANNNKGLLGPHPTSPNLDSLLTPLLLALIQIIGIGGSAPFTGHPTPPTSPDPHKYITNLSSHSLDKASLGILSKGLSFVPTPNPPSLDLLQEDFQTFSRSLRLTHFFWNSTPTPRHPFKPKSSWQPPPSSNPNVEQYISLTTSALSSIPTRNIHPIIQPAERRALQQLRHRKDLTIKQADKGSGIVIKDTSYILNGLTHLEDTTIYQKLEGDPTPHVSEHIGAFIDNLLERNYIDKHTHTFLKPPAQPRTQRLYFLKKIPKNPHGIRPIVSGCNGPTEHISAYLDHFLKPLVPLIPSYTRDSGHIIHTLEQTTFPQNCILVTIDVSSLYLDIPQDEGTSSCINALGNNIPLPKNILRTLFDIVLICNIFSFHQHAFKQIQGTAMGTKMAPSYANLFMADVETSFLDKETIKPALWKRYIDDILCVWTSTREHLEAFLQRLNQHHPTLRFTYSISEESVDFLDTRIYKGDRFKTSGILDIQTYFKPTNTFQYLHYSSSHPKGNLKGLVKGEAIRFLRTNSDPTNFEHTLSTFRHHLLARNFPKNLVDPILATVPFSARPQYVQPLNPNPNPIPNSKTIPRFITPYSPYLNTLRQVLTDNWELISKDEQLCQLFEEPQLCYKKNTSISNLIVRATTTGPYPSIITDLPLEIPCLHPRIKPCNNARCRTCPNILPYSAIHSSLGKHFHLPKNITCSSTNIIYAIVCKKCTKTYVGQTSLTLRARFCAHKSAARANKNWPIYSYFSRRGHSFERDAGLVSLEGCKKEELLDREIHWMITLNSFLPKGLNTLSVLL